MITSTSNPKIKELKQLQKKAKLRQEKGLFIAEGLRMVGETPKERVFAAYVAEHFEKEHADWLARWDVPYETVVDSIFDSVCDTKTPQGILCLVKRQEWTMDELLAGKSESCGQEDCGQKDCGSVEGHGQEESCGKKRRAPFFLLIENLQDPGNLGTIFRTGEAAGVSGIIMNRETVDIYNPKTVRSTMGAIYRVPFLYTDSLERAIEQLKTAGIRIYAAHLKGETNYSDFSYEKGTAFLIGNEGNGLSEQIVALADAYLKIPMEGQAESLNAAVAAAVLMYEVHRQRRKNNNCKVI